VHRPTQPDATPEVGRSREPGAKDIARDFVISESSLTTWLVEADVEEGVNARRDRRRELRAARRRIRLRRAGE
jgi:transposase